MLVVSTRALPGVLAACLLALSGCGDGVPAAPPAAPLVRNTDPPGDCRLHEIVDGSALRTADAPCLGNDVRTVSWFDQEGAFALEVALAQGPPPGVRRSLSGSIAVEQADGDQWRLLFTCDHEGLRLAAARASGPAEEIPVTGLGCRGDPDRLELVLDRSAFALDDTEKAGRPVEVTLAVSAEHAWLDLPRVVDRADEALAL